MRRRIANLYGRMLRGVLLPSIMAGLLVALAAIAGAVTFASSRPTGFQVDARLVVLPSEGLDVGTTTAYYETLSRGQITGTYAEVLQLERFTATAADELGLTPAERAEVDVSAVVIPESTMISLTVAADDARTATSLAGLVIEEGTAYIEQLSEGYALELVNAPDGTAVATGLSGVQYAVVMAIAALVIGVAAQQVVQQVLQALDRRAEMTLRRRHTDAVPGEAVADEEPVPSWPSRPRVPR